MKKLFTIILIGFISLQFASAQELGFRIGDVVGGNAAVDFVLPFKSGRLHADISFGYGYGVGVEVLYDFLYDEIGSGFYYYVGAGPYALIDDPFKLGIEAEGGVEYRFEGAPIALGLDWRPRFQIIDVTDFHVGGFGFNARFVF